MEYLINAIRLVTADHDWEVNETPNPVTAVREARKELDHTEIDFWELKSADLASAYHTVLAATEANIATALDQMTAE